MQLVLYWILIIASSCCAKIMRNRNIEKRRAPSAFELARLQRDYDADSDSYESSESKGTDSSLRRDEVVSERKCLERCTNQLNIGMDMVNAHMSFGSIDLPSVVEQRDLELFCLLDRQHTQCVDECGYAVQFNLREYVCRSKFDEMLTHMPCYVQAAPALLRHCRPRCGTYTSLQHTLSGYAQRCRQLLCDHSCVNFILGKICPEEKARRAGAFLLEFTRLQVNYWMNDLMRTLNVSSEASYPSSCARLQCDDFLGDCDRR